jgi:hypothetical protein
MIAAALRAARLVALAFSLSGDVSDAFAVADDALAAAPDEWTARWLVVWLWHESRWMSDVVDPTGATVGAMRVDASTWGTPPTDRLGQYEQAVEILDVLTLQCGSRRRALNAYATGRCDIAADLVSERCAAIGGCQ